MKVSESVQKIDGALWMLHRVAPDRPETVFQKVDQETRITPEYLEKLIVEAKESGYRFLSLDQFLANKHAGKGSEKDIVVTIDDGYRDIYQYAWPIFEKHQVPFVFYVASDFIQFGFEHCKRPELDGGQLAMDIIYHHQNFEIGGKKYPAASLEEKAACFNALWKKFKRIKRFKPWASGRKLLQNLLPGYEMDFAKYKAEYVCSPEELREMNRSPLCTIGSHAKSHTPLFKIFLRTHLRRELSESQQFLEKVLGEKVEHFSYPYGSYCKKVDGLVRRYYKSAAAVGSASHEGDVYCAGDDDYILPRVHVKTGLNPLTQVKMPAALRK